MQTHSDMIEALELRVQCDSDVNVSFTNGVLRVSGNESDNFIRVTRLASGNYRVETTGALNGADSIDSTVMQSFDTGQRPSRLILSAGGGADQVELINLAGGALKMNIDMNAGADTLSLRGCSPLSADVGGGSGNDRIFMRNSTNVPTFRIFGGSGNDRIELVGLSTRLIDISSAGGNDVTTVSRCTTRAGLDYTGGSGDDVLGLRYVNLSGHTSLTDDAGRSTMSLNQIKLFSSLEITTGPLDDVLELLNVRVSGDLNASLGAGNDRYVQLNVVPESGYAFNIDLGAGDNTRTEL